MGRAACRAVVRGPAARSSPEGSSHGLGLGCLLRLCRVPGSRPANSLAHDLSRSAPPSHPRDSRALQG